MWLSRENTRSIRARDAKGSSTHRLCARGQVPSCPWIPASFPAYRGSDSCLLVLGSGLSDTSNINILQFSRIWGREPGQDFHAQHSHLEGSVWPLVWRPIPNRTTPMWPPGPARLPSEWTSKRGRKQVCKNSKTWGMRCDAAPLAIEPRLISSCVVPSTSGIRVAFPMFPWHQGQLVKAQSERAKAPVPTETR